MLHKILQNQKKELEDFEDKDGLIAQPVRAHA